MISARWGIITAGQIASIVGGKLLRGPDRTPFLSLGTDSRQILHGQLFWALKGENHDGHDFAAEAIRKGASGAVIQEDRGELARVNGASLILVSDTLEALGRLAAWWRRQYRVDLAAITGSMGKTTTKTMAASILALGRKTLSNHGNFNNLIGLPLSLFQLTEEHGAVVLEMGMNRRGEIARLTEIADPDVGLITNVGRVHLEGLGDIMGVAGAKVELVEKMSQRGIAILNGDDEVLMKAALSYGKKVMTFGLSRGNDLQAGLIRNLGTDGVSFELRHQGNKIPIRLSVPGQHNVMNGLAAAAISLSLGETYEHIAEGLSAFQGIPGRFTATRLSMGALLVDDTYNSNPSSLSATMKQLKNLVPEGGRLLVGLGDMLELGAESEAAHLEAGAMVANLGVHLFVVTGEHAVKMIDGAVRSGLPRNRTAVVASHGEMVQIFRKHLKTGDLLFLKASRRIGLDRVARALKDEQIQGGMQ